MTLLPKNLAGNGIVIAGGSLFGSSTEGLAHGFRQLGWNVDEVDMRDHFVHGSTLTLRLAGRALRHLFAASYNKAVLNAIDMAQPRAFLTCKGSYLHSATLKEIRRRGVITVNYYPDVHFNYVGLDFSTFKHYDLFFTTKSFQVEYLQALLGSSRVHFLHHGYSSIVHRPRLAEIREDNYMTDVLYVGNYSPYKKFWLAAIAQQLPDVKLMIVGNRWTRAASHFAPQATVSMSHVLGDRYARLLQSARINIAVHMGPTGPGDWEDLVSTRTFEIPACRGFMLHIDNDEVRGLFKPGQEIDVFSTPEELCEKIRAYLRQPESRAAMIDRAFARCVPNYSYDARAGVIAAAIDEVFTRTQAGGIGRAGATRRYGRTDASAGKNV